MPDLVAEAIARRDALLAEVSRLDQFIETAKSLESGGLGVAPAPAPLSAAEATPAALVTAVSGILREAGRPLGRGEIFRRLQAGGVRISGVDPVKNLGTILWRSGRFDNTGRAYWFKDEPRPDEG